jgi:outer membrane protease
MSKFKEITNEGFTQKNGSHYVRDLEFREPTKEAAYIYCQNFINYFVYCRSGF